MTILDIPVWTIPPDWASVVTEGLEWLTEVMASATGAEQRQALRLSPRRHVEFTVSVTGQWRTYFDALMTTAFQDRLYLPLWFESAKTVQPIAAGGTWLTVQGTRAELASSLRLFLQGPKPYQFEIVEVSGSYFQNGQTIFSLTTGTTGTWGRGTKVYPVKVAMFSAQPMPNRLSDQALTSDMQFQILETNDWTGDASLPTYRGVPVLEIVTNETDSQAVGYDRITAISDNTTGVPVILDIAGIPFQKHTPNGFFSGHFNADRLRSTFYALKGRCKPAWLVSPAADFTLTAPASIGGASITVDRSGFSDLGTPVAGRQDIRILMRSGDAWFHRITGSALAGTDHETLNLSPALAASLTLANVRRISFMGLGRLDQDRIDLVHQTDNDGICRVAAATKMVPDLRTASDWEPPSLQYILQDGSGCGPAFPGQLWARINNLPWNDNPSASPSFGVGGLDITAITGDLFPLVGFNTGFLSGSAKANFGADLTALPFNEPVPVRVRAWDVAGGTVWNPADKNASISLADGNLTAGLGSEITGAYVRATTSTGGPSRLAYYEVTLTAAAQDTFVGFANATFNLSQPLFGPDPTGSVWVKNDRQIWLNGAPTGIILAGSIGDGDTISLVVYR